MNLIFFLCNNRDCTPDKFCSPKLLSYFQKSTSNEVKNIVNKIIQLSLKAANFESFENKRKKCSAETTLEKYPSDSIENCTYDKLRLLEEDDFNGGFSSIFNVLFKIEKPNQDADIRDCTDRKKMIITDSILKNLKTLVFGITTGSPILVSGDIGCGKTSLIEYFAQCLGRTAPPFLLKLQLGDQIESKVMK